MAEPMALPSAAWRAAPKAASRVARMAANLAAWTAVPRAGHSVAQKVGQMAGYLVEWWVLHLAGKRADCSVDLWAASKEPQSVEQTAVKTGPHWAASWVALRAEYLVAQ